MTWHQFIFASFILLAGAIGCFALAYCNVRRWKRMLLITFGLVLLLPSLLVLAQFTPELVDGRYRTFKRFYRTIQPGMTRAEVHRQLDHYYPSGGKRLPPKVYLDTETSLSFLMNPEKSLNPDCEGFIVKMHNNFVVGKEYAAD